MHFTFHNQDTPRVCYNCDYWFVPHKMRRPWYHVVWGTPRIWRMLLYYARQYQMKKSMGRITISDFLLLLLQRDH